MNNKTVLKIAAITGVIITVATIVVAIVTKLSFVNNVDQRIYMNGNYRVSLMPDLNEVFLDNQIKNMENLEEVSDVIVRVKVDLEEERKFNSDMTITNVKIVEVYKGNVEEDDIYIIEPVYYFTSGDYIISTQGYYWMNDEDEYILFLEKVKDAHFGEQEYIYLPTTTLYSKYNMNKADDLEHAAKGHKIYQEIYEAVCEKYVK